jgi:IclR family acetate operon transcriptional repressor
MAVLFDNHIEVVSVLESSHMIRMGNTVGRIIPPHASSLGKSITASQSEERRDTLLRSYGLHRFTASTITDESELKSEFERIRERGYATEKEESTPDGFCFGAPVWHEERVIASISLAFPKMRLPARKDQDALIQSLTALTRTTGEKLAE